MSKPKLLEALGSSRTDRLTDENLKTLHLYLFLALLRCEGELRERGLNRDDEIYIRISKPMGE